MSDRPLKLGTRGSPLAMWQAHMVRDRIGPVCAPRPVEIVIIQTHGDQIQDRPLSAIGGFGVFTKRIQDSLLAGVCDIAVHSLKDLPTIPVPGLMLAATPPRGPVADALISLKHASFDALPLGATVATSSVRRRAQMLFRRPDLNMVELRGNVDTRLRKLREQNLDAIVLAQAGLERLGLAERITEVIEPERMLPAVGQGAVGVECRSDDAEALAFAQAINDPATWAAVLAERALLSGLGGGCLIPIGCFTGVEGGVLRIRAAVFSRDGRRAISDSHEGPRTSPEGIGLELAARLRAAGAGEILAQPGEATDGPLLL